MKLMARYPDNHFDLAIVDPPYGLGTSCFGGSNKNTHEDKSWNKNIPGPEYFSELIRVSVNQIIWGCNYYGDNIKVPGRIVHYKETEKHSGALNLSSCDLASQSFTNTINYFHFRWAGNVQGSTINWKNAGRNGRIHPTQKPVELYEWCLDTYAKPGDRILDTHLGSGSIAIACHYRGFDLTACELNKEYFEAACKRIANQTVQKAMDFQLKT